MVQLLGIHSTLIYTTFTFHSIHIHIPFHSHGPRIKPCTGSHKPPANDDRPIATTDSMSHTQPVDTQALGGSSNTQIPINLKNTAHSYSCVNMQHPSLHVGLIRHIPKLARPSTCKLLTNIINLVISDNMSLSNWQSFLTFGSTILEKPVRGDADIT